MAIKPQTFQNNSKLVDPTQYQKLLFALQYLTGALQYLTFTRSDIVHEENRVC